MMKGRKALCLKFGKFEKKKEGKKKAQLLETKSGFGPKCYPFKKKRLGNQVQ